VRLKSSSRIHTDIPLLALATLVLLAQPSGNAFAEDLLGLYVGGAIGQSRVEATGLSYNVATPGQIGNPNDTYIDNGSFKQNHSAFKVMVGIRPISLLGAELAYTDFGHPSGSFNLFPADVSMKGESAFGVLYLPVPLIDFFVKAGLARIQSELSGTGAVAVQNPPIVGFAPFQLDRTNTSFAAGAGVQYRIGSWAVRAEYERFNAAGGNPSLMSAGVTWSFF
jgi:opacity protein-like surface antigen